MYSEFDFLLNSWLPSNHGKNEVWFTRTETFEHANAMLCTGIFKLLSKREHKYLSYVINLRNIWASFILFDAPAELQAKLHYAVQYPRD